VGLSHLRDRLGKREIVEDKAQSLLNDYIRVPERERGCPMG